MADMESKPSLCNVCDRSFVYRDVLELHIDTLHPELPNLKKSSLNEQEASKKNKMTKKKDLCPYPDCKVMPRSRDLHGHIKRMHEPISLHEEGVCAHCGKIVRKQSLSAHIKKLHTAEINHCKMCSFTTRDRHTMSRHYTLRHTKGIQTPCSVCGKLVKNVTTHLYYSSCGTREKSVQCLYCDVKFYRRGKLNIHIERIHQKIRNKKCQKCPYTTYTNYNLRLHVSKVHDKTVMIEKCPHCEKKTGSLERHIKTYHSEQMDVLV